jgi:hypothetical protein
MFIETGFGASLIELAARRTADTDRADRFGANFDRW